MLEFQIWTVAQKIAIEWLTLEFFTEYLISISHVRNVNWQIMHFKNSFHILLCVYMCVYVYTSVYIPKEGMAGIRGRWKEEGKWEGGRGEMKSRKLQPGVNGKVFISL